MKVVLTIAGLDPSGGAGIVADIRTITNLGCFPAAAITSITYQNTTGVFGVENQSAATLRSQIDPIVADLDVAAVKTGMLPTAEIVAEVARLCAAGQLPAPVVDPVMVSTSGHDLIGDEAFQILKAHLLPVARVVTPNLPEAERLAGFGIETEADMRRAAEVIKSFGASAVLIKGGHRKVRRQGQGAGAGVEAGAGAGEALDLLLTQDGEFVEFSDEYLEVGEIHGSGCTLSAAIAAELAKGLSLTEAVRSAKSYVSQRIRSLLTAERIGKGAFPL